MNELVSVIVSVYNEDLDVLKKSIFSVLNQTYKQLEIVLINDNPKREDLSTFLKELASSDSRIKYLVNEKNLGLVASLNRGIAASTGSYIARMDADDISDLRRIEFQISYLEEHNLDIVGANVLKIDEKDNVIGRIFVPESDKFVKKYYKYGSCLLHPTWFAKKSLFVDLTGYRNIYSCEDYDFIMRAMQNDYRFGNFPRFLLKYRIRNDGISVSSEATQKLTMYFIRKNRNRVSQLSEDDFDRFRNSKKYARDYKRISKYISIKNSFKSNKNIFKVFVLLFNKYFYVNLFSNLVMRNKEKHSNVIQDLQFKGE